MRQLRSALTIDTPETEAERRLREFRPPEFRPQEFRPLGAFENIFAAYNETAITNFTLMAELEGEISKPAVERALAQVQARHPLLAVGIRHGADGRRVFVRSERPIPLTELPTGAVPWELAAGLEIRRAFDVEQGPLMLASIRFEAKCLPPQHRRRHFGGVRDPRLHARLERRTLGCLHLGRDARTSAAGGAARQSGRSGRQTARARSGGRGALGPGHESNAGGVVAGLCPGLHAAAPGGRALP